MTHLISRLVIRLALSLFGLLVSDAVLGAPTFTMGILPVHSTRVLVERYEPLRAHLEDALRRPVRIETAPDFVRFQQRILRGDFDLAITPAHFARLAQKDAGFQPLVQFSPDHDALLIVNADRPLNSPKEMKGRQLAVIDRLAITVMAALHYLDEQGVEPDQDFTVLEHRTHASVAHAVVSGASAAAVTTSQGMLQIPEDLRRKIKVYRHIANIPAFVFLARPEAASSEVEQLKALLLAFPQKTEGIDFLKRTGYTGLNLASEALMRRADPYLRETQKVLKP